MIQQRNLTATSTRSLLSTHVIRFSSRESNKSELISEGTVTSLWPLTTTTLRTILRTGDQEVIARILTFPHDLSEMIASQVRIQACGNLYYRIST